MSRVFERPRAARRAHSGFILVEHHGFLLADSERREYPLQLRAELRDAALGGVGMMKRERIEMTRALKMPGAEILGGSSVDEHQAGVATMLAQPSRIDQHFRFALFAASFLPDQVAPQIFPNVFPDARIIDRFQRHR